MSVLKNLRSLSEMQFYKTAIAIRKELTVWLLKDFGAKRNVKSVNQVIKDITEDEQKIIDGIFAKYGKTSKHTYQSEYPEWFVNFEREIISRNLAELVTNITEANSIYPRKNNNQTLQKDYYEGEKKTTQTKKAYGRGIDYAGRNNGTIQIVARKHHEIQQL